MCSILSSRTVFSLVVLLVLSSSPIFGYLANAQEENEDGQEQQKDIPDVNATIGGETVSIRDSNLRVETIAEGLEFPTTMAFLGPNDILVLEKEKTHFRE
jgi:glucose/arabinose dehydrogenase